MHLVNTKFVPLYVHNFVLGMSMEVRKFSTFLFFILKSNSQRKYEFKGFKLRIHKILQISSSKKGKSVT